MNQIKQSTLFLLNSSKNDGILIYVVKHLETLVLCYSYASQDSKRDKRDEFTLDNIPNNHSILSALFLKEQGEFILNALNDAIISGKQ